MIKSEIDAIIEENQFLKTIINNAPGYFFVVDKDGKPIFVTGDSKKIMGIPDELIKDISVKDFKAKGYTDRSTTSEEVLSTGKPVSRYLISKAGTPLWICTRPVFDDDGNILYAVSYTMIEEEEGRLHTELINQKSETKQIINYINSSNLTIPFIAKDKAAAAMFEFARNVAKTDSTVLLCGETGTGKEVMARYIHQCSNISDNIFLPVNCAAIPSELLESEFFGYEGGAFTGARKEGKMGLFEMADGGTLFLDEIAELPMLLQGKLLRVLESGEVKKIGSNESVHTQVRIIAATNKNLKKLVQDGKFREDLYYRLNVVPIIIMPLRDRPEDIIPLAEKFLNDLNKKYNTKKYFAPESLHFLQKYSWPGNIRELKNLIERYVVAYQDDRIVMNEGFDMDEGNAKNMYQNQSNFNFSDEDGLKDYMDRIEEKVINDVIKKNDGNYTLAAKELKINRSALYKKIEKYRKK